MPITKTVQADNGITITYHRAIGLAVDLVANTAQVTVNSHSSEQAALDGLPIAWQWRVGVPVAQLAGDEPTLLGEVEKVLITLDSSPFAGGERGVDRSVDLEVLKARKRAEITRDRLAADAGHFSYAYTYTNAEGAEVSESKAIRTADKDMTDLLASNSVIVLLGMMPPQWPGGWKAMDDSYVRISNVDEWKAFFLAMYNAGIENFMWSQELKARLDVATTAEEIEAIGWSV